MLGERVDVIPAVSSHGIMRTLHLVLLVSCLAGSQAALQSEISLSKISWCPRYVTNSSGRHAIRKYKVCCFHPVVRRFPGVGDYCKEMYPGFF